MAQVFISFLFFALPGEVQLAVASPAHFHWSPARMGPSKEPISMAIPLLLCLCVVLLNYTSHSTSVKSVKIHKGLCVTGGRLYHVILDISAA